MLLRKSPEDLISHADGQRIDEVLVLKHGSGSPPFEGQALEVDDDVISSRTTPISP
jgi:hypothetical protein